MNNVVLHLGDCLEYMRTLPDGAVDAVVTDPPFGIGFEYNEHKDDASQYEALMLALVPELQRLVKDGFVFCWQAMKNADNWHKWFPSGYRVFAGLRNFTQFMPTPVQYSWDPVIFWSIGEIPISPVAGQRDYHIGNTARYVAEKSNGHPCPRPLDTVSYIVESFTLKGATVFDPFMGSGTTGVACVRTGRNFIGCEIDATYFAIAQRRIAEVQMQPPLFPHEPQPQVQQLHLDALDTEAK